MPGMTRGQTAKRPSPDNAGSAALARVARGRLCAGCGACAVIAPGTVSIERQGGFLRPMLSGPVAPAEEAEIARVCPGLRLEQEAGDRPDHPLWGPLLEVSAIHATDAGLRHAGASGGGLSAILLHLIESGRVAAAIANGPDPDDPMANATVLLRDRAGILAAAGSRYAPSAPLAALGALLAAEPDPLAFVGKPCDAAALRALMRERPALAERIPYVLSFFCAGVPSFAGGEEILGTLGAARDELAGFRYRGNGWPGRATATMSDGTTRSMSYADSWGGILSRHVQHRCKICADGAGAFADIACADAWETDARGYPLFAERPGVSLVVTRTARGAALLADAAEAGRLVRAPLPEKAIAAMQPGQLRRRRVLVARLAALRLCGLPVPRYRGLSLLAAARTGSPLDALRNFLGTLRRALLGRF